MAIVAAIGTTLLAAASPEFLQLAADSQLRSAASHLRSGLRVAQAEALGRQRRVELVLTNDEPVAAGVVPSDDGRNWVVQTVLDDGRHEWIAGYSGAERTPRARVHAERSVFEFDAFGRLAAEEAAPGVRHAWGIEIVDGLSRVRPLRVQIDAGGSTMACDPSAAPTDSFRCG